MLNPYLCYAISFTVVLITYSFGWSAYYPPLSLSLLTFILLTIAINLFLGIRMVRKKSIIFYPIELKYSWSPLIITSVIYIGWLSEFIYEGGIPLLKILLKQPYDYRLFGIPSFHVIIVTFSSFYTLYLFHLYLSGKSSFVLWLYGINLLAALLIYNRGMLLFNLAGCAILYLNAYPKIQGKPLMIGVISIFVLFYLFGVFGSLRVSHSANGSYTNYHFLITGNATESFRKSIVPKEFFWSYIYISSPLANLQQNINTYSVQPVSFTNALNWANNEVLPDFISKRINNAFDKTPLSDNRIYDPLSASTVYSRSFSYLGWTGILLMGLIIVLLPRILLRVLPPSSPFFLSGFAILSTMFAFMIFENMVRFTGLSFQLVYPIVLSVLVQWLPVLKKYF